MSTPHCTDAAGHLAGSRVSGQSAGTRTVVVTGASGFVGQAVAARLSRDFRVRGVTRKRIILPGLAETVALPPPVSGWQGWAELLGGADHVVHCAAIAHSSGVTEAEYHAVNVELTARLAEAAARVLPGTFVHVSSIRAATGPTAATTVADATEPAPTDAYGRSKLASEGVIAELLGETGRLGMLRPVLVYGRRMRGNLAQLQALAQRRWLLPLAGLKGRRSLLDVEALAEACAHLIAKGIEGALDARPHAIADRDPLTTGEIVAAFREGLGREPGLFAVPDGLLRAGLTLAGRRGDWERLDGDLVADASRLANMGWHQPTDTAARLAALTREPDGQSKVWTAWTESERKGPARVERARRDDA